MQLGERTASCTAGGSGLPVARAAAVTNDMRFLGLRGMLFPATQHAKDPRFYEMPISRFISVRR